MADTDEKRETLVKLREVLRKYEGYKVTRGPDLMAGVRYSLSTSATDLNGDDCMFPACDCPKADCSDRPKAKVLEGWGCH